MQLFLNSGIFLLSFASLLGAQWTGAAAGEGPGTAGGTGGRGGEGGGGSGLRPAYLWPLGNGTAHREVMRGRDAQLPGEAAVAQCFVFGSGPAQVGPGEALTLGAPGVYLDVLLAGEVDFKDMSMSLYILPESPSSQGTLLSYRCATGNVIRLSVMQGMLFVSLWDEYGVSVGMTAVPSPFTARTWSHIVLVRVYATGRIQIYHDGEILDDIDDDFPNGIQLPTAGTLRLGKGQGDSDPGFRGRYACFQLFDTPLTPEDITGLPANCRPEAWSIHPQVTFEIKQVNGEQKQCLTNASPPAVPDLPLLDEQLKALNCDLLGLHCLTGSPAWQTVMRKHKWEDSGRNVAYFRIVSRGRLPADAAAGPHLLGKVSASDRRMCSRLCMRIRGCMAFSYNGARDWPGGVECCLYDRVLNATQDSEESRYYSLRSDGNIG